jgi:uncharacterized protein (TIGR02118 family)
LGAYTLDQIRCDADLTGWSASHINDEEAIVAMAKLVVLYPPPVDADEFDRAYAEEHVALMAEKMKGAKVAVTSVKAAALDPPPYYRMAEIWGESISALEGFVQSADGLQVAGHASRSPPAARPSCCSPKKKSISSDAHGGSTVPPTPAGRSMPAD